MHQWRSEQGRQQIIFEIFVRQNTIDTLIQCASTFTPVTQDQLKTAQPQPPKTTGRHFSLLFLFFYKDCFPESPQTIFLMQRLKRIKEQCLYISRHHCYKRHINTFEYRYSFIFQSMSPYLQHDLLNRFVEHNATKDQQYKFKLNTKS